MKDRPLNVIMFAGGLRASAFREQLGVPTLRLPVGRHATLLDAWLNCFEALERACHIHIVVSRDDDVTYLKRQARHHGESATGAMHIDVRQDPAPWRGTGGLLRDVTIGFRDDDLLMVVESACLPPKSLQPALDALTADIDGVVCGTADHEPAGVYLLRAAALGLIPAEGFFDLKEQFLPQAYAANRRLACAVVVERVQRLRDLEAYVAAQRALLNGHDAPVPVVADDARIAPSARLIGASVVESGVVVEDGAAVHDSVLLRGARIGAGAVVSRSVVASDAEIPAAAVRRDTLEPRAVVTKATGGRRLNLTRAGSALARRK